RQTHDVAEVASCLRRVDVDRADHLEPGPRRDLFDDGRADRAKTEMQHANVWHKGELYSASMAADHPRALTREHVVWAYRLLLDRDPESEDVVGPKLAGSRDSRELRHHLITSAEF